MSEQSYHQSIHLQNFTVFRDVQLEFSPGINAFVGENGTGKTHLMKVLYAVQLDGWKKQNGDSSIDQNIRDLFLNSQRSELITLGSPWSTQLLLEGSHNRLDWWYKHDPQTPVSAIASGKNPTSAFRPVFFLQ